MSRTCEFIDSSLCSHIGQSDDTLCHITSSLIHLYQCVGSDVPSGVVSDVDCISASALQWRETNSKMERTNELMDYNLFGITHLTRFIKHRPIGAEYGVVRGRHI